jgi:ribosomal-protein-alanine N-acetyltransferase
MLGSAAPVVVESGSRLCTARLVLRPLRASDQRSWIQLVRKSRDDLDAFAPLHEPGESDEALFARQMSLTTEGEHTGVSWRRVAVLDDGSLIGCFNINSVRRGLAMEGDVNWWLGTPYQRKGLATEALGALIDYAFMTLPTGLGLDRLWASIQPGNERSKRLADRVGFCPASDGTDRLRLSGGHWTAHDLYAVDAPREPLTVLPQV